MKIAILSSAKETVDSSLIPKINLIIRLLKKHNAEILTGGCLGIPGIIVKKAKMAGLKTYAYSPDKNKGSHNKREDNLNLQYFHSVKYFSGFTSRSIDMLNSADGVLILNGRMGTLSEFTIALEEGKRVGVITDTGGIADHLKKILNLTKKDFGRQIYFDSDPDKVIKWLLSKTSTYK